MSLNLRTAVGHIEKYGILLVYPIAGKSDPASLWSVAYPRSKMRWEWDDNGDDRVARLWHLREELSRSKKVVYAKWLNGRATFFSREVFAALPSRFERARPMDRGRREAVERSHRAVEIGERGAARWIDGGVADPRVLDEPEDRRGAARGGERDVGRVLDDDDEAHGIVDLGHLRRQTRQKIALDAVAHAEEPVDIVR